LVDKETGSQICCRIPCSTKSKSKVGCSCSRSWSSDEKIKVFHKEILYFCSQWNFPAWEIG